MYATVLHGPGDVRYERVSDPKILKPTDAIIQLSVTCICGSDLWPYRGISPLGEPMHMGHEYCGVVVEVGSEVRTVKPGQFVVGSFCISDNTCDNTFSTNERCGNRLRGPAAQISENNSTIAERKNCPRVPAIAERKNRTPTFREPPTACSATSRAWDRPAASSR